MSLTLLGIGTAIPSCSVGQAEAAELAQVFCCNTEEQVRQLNVIYKRTQIRQRNSVLSRDSFLSSTAEKVPTTQERMERYAQEALPLTLAAARKALAESKIQAHEITDLVTVSCTGFFSPGVDAGLIKRLDLKPATTRTHIGFMGCHGALNGLRVASALAQARPDSRVLLSAVELCSLHFYYGWDPGKVVANGLFADGAAALVMGSSLKFPPKADQPLAGKLNSHLWRLKANGAYLFPDSEDAMAWKIGNHGFEMELSPELPALILTHLRPWLENWLKEEGIRFEEIRSWAIHPGGPRVLQAVGDCLELPEEALSPSREVLAEYGNMSSPTILFILERLQRREAPLPCVALGFGPGLAAEAALLV